MGFYINFDQDNIDTYYLGTEISARCQEVLDTFYNTHKLNDSSFPSTANSLAKGNFTYSWYNKNFIQQIKGNILQSRFVPIELNFEFSYHKSFSFNAFLNENANSIKPQLNENPFPIAIRYVDKNGFYYVERPPFQTEVDFKANGNLKVGSSVKIWIPWTLTVFHPSNIANSMIYFSDQQLTDEKTRYVPSFLPNTYQDGKICFGASLASDSNYQNSSDTNNIRLLYATLFNEYMTGGWNIDLYPNILAYVHSTTKNEILKKFNNISAEEFLIHYPRMTKRAAENLANNNLTYPYSRYETYKYMFYTLGTMNLEETLDFYSAVLSSEGKERTLAFEDIKQKTSSSFQGYGSIIRSINTKCPSTYDHSKNSFIKIRMMLVNYENDLYASGSEEILLKDGPNFGSAVFSSIHKSEQIHKKVFEIFETENLFGYKNDSIYVYDLGEDKLTRNTVDPKDFNSYYSYLINNHCKPLENLTPEKVDV